MVETVLIYIIKNNDCLKINVSKYGVISGPYLFGLNTEIYEANLHIQSEHRKIRTRNNSVFGHFSRTVFISFIVSLKFTNLQMHTIN